MTIETRITDYLSFVYHADNLCSSREKLEQAIGLLKDSREHIRGLTLPKNAPKIVANRRAK